MNLKNNKFKPKWYRWHKDEIQAFALVLSIVLVFGGITYGAWRLSYADMIQETVRQLVNPEYLKDEFKVQ